jgi:single-strand DNA-binding protein
MSSMAKVIIVGNLGRDAEMKYLGSGTPVLEFSVAANERWKDQAGNLQEHTQWFRVSLFGRQAESLKPYLLKGKSVYVDGRLRIREYTDREGQKRFSCDVRADTIQLVGRREDSGHDGGRDYPANGPSGGPSSNAPSNQGDDPSYTDEDVPF